MTSAAILHQTTIFENGLINEETGVDMRDELRATANRYLTVARELEWAMEGRSLQPTPDEEREEIKAIIEKEFGESRYRVSGTLPEKIRGILATERVSRSEAFGLVATLSHELQVKLEAMDWVLKSALTGGTHREKNKWIELGRTACTEIMAELQRIDPDTLSRYTSWDWKSGSWNIRKLQSDVYHKDDQIRRLQERIAELESGQPSVKEAPEVPY